MEITNFDATNIQPQQLTGGKHPLGNFRAVIANTSAQATKDNTGGMFVVDFRTDAGTIQTRFNLWNSNQTTVDIAQKQLAWLCNCVGIFKLSMTSENLSMCGHELRGAPCVIDVALQDASKPDGYVEVKKIYDKNGNEPGKAPANAPQTQQGGGWGGGNGQAPQQQANPNPAPANTGGGWSTGPTMSPAAQAQPQQQGGNGAPPWANANK